jgi:putative pantetheine hydrolase
VQAGPTNSLLDVAGVRVGHHTAHGDGRLTGTTVVLSPDGGAVAGVDVRCGGPGTRETDLLDPRNQVERVDAVVLSGGSAYGLAAADGVVRCLAAADRGFRIGPRAGEVVPIVPAAVVFDLGRGGSFAGWPDAASGAEAYAAAGTGPVAQGVVGAGTGAVAGGLKGGVGTASAVLPDGATVAALVVVNAVGSTVDPLTGELYGARFGLPGEFALTTPSPAEVTAARVVGPAVPVLATTIGVIATDALLTKAQCAKVAGVGHDGLARAVRPVHSMLDGDTLFALATGVRETVVHDLLTGAADCVTRAVVHAMLAATTVTTPAGTWRAYADAFPSALARGR